MRTNTSKRGTVPKYTQWRCCWRACVSDDYIAYLHSKEISYIFGSEALDLALVMQKLHDLLRIDRLMICGGGIVDYTFL